MNTIQTTDVFIAWFEAMKDRAAKMWIQARIRRAEGVSEMRVHVGAGYRVYFKQVGMEVFVLLAGGDKASQSRDIQTALDMARKIGA